MAPVQKSMIVAALAAAAAGLWLWASAPDASPPPTHAPAARPDARLDARPAAPAAVVPPRAETEATRAVPERTEVTPSAGVAAAATHATGDAPRGIAGHVRWHDGDPAAGVTVLCQRADGDSLLSQHATVAGPDGAFQFVGLEPAGYLVTSDRGGRRLTAVRPGKPRLHEIELRIPAGCELEGRVADAAGRPVRGARLWLTEPHLAERGQVVATTDAEGRYRVRAAGASRFVGVRARGFRPSPLHYLEDAPGTARTLDFTLQRGAGRVIGRVFDHQGQPVAGALVRLIPPGQAWMPSPFGGHGRRWSAVRVHTGDDGGFVAEDVPPGEILVQARAAGHGATQPQLVVAAGGTAEVVCTLTAAARIEGVARDAEGEPLGGAHLRCASVTDAVTGVQGQTDADGTFALDDVTPGRVQVQLWHGREVAVRATLDVAPGQTLTWNPQLGTQPVIAGRVLDATRQAMPGLTVWAYEGNTFRGKAVTDRDGAFLIEGLEPRPHTVRVTGTGRGGSLALLVLTEVLPATHERELVVPRDALPACAVRGTVRAPDGGVPAGAEVILGHAGGLGIERAVPDPDTGAFAVDDLPSGDYWIRLHCDDFPQLSLGKHTLAPGEPFDLGVLQCVRGGRLRGELLLPAGVAPDSVALSVVDARGGSPGTVHRDVLRFRTAPLPEGRYFLLSSALGCALQRTPFEILAGAEVELQVALAAGHRYRIRATLPTGEPNPARMHMTVLQNGEVAGGGALQPPNAGAPWQAEVWLAPGAYTIAVGSPGNRLHGMTRLQASRGGEVEVRLTPR